MAFFRKPQIISSLSALRQKIKKSISGRKVGIKRRKYLISEMCTFVVCSVIFPGYTEAEFAKISDFEAQFLKNGSTTKSENSQEESKKTLKKEDLFTDSDESLILRHKTKSKSKAKGIEMEEGEIHMQVKEKKSDTKALGEEDQIKVHEMGIPKGKEAQVKRRESRIPQEQEAQVKMNDTGITQGQGFQIKKSESRIQGQEFQVEKNESGMPQAQGSQVKKESSENKGKQGKDKGDGRKNKDTEENDTMKKIDEGKHKVKGKKESEVKGKKQKVQ